MIHIENVLPDEVARDLRGLYMDAEYFVTEQRHDVYYNDNSGEGFPVSTESYFSRFQRSLTVEELPQFSEAFERYIKPLLAEHMGPITERHVFAYKMTEGDHFRLHTDSHSGRGFVYYLCEGWRWDWGGLLVALDGGAMVPHLPKFNSLVILDGENTPHFVTQVAHYAKEPRYAMVGFARRVS